MTVLCDNCLTKATSNSDKYYLIRITNSGLDFTDGMVDYTLCVNCLETRLDDSTRRGEIQSIVRIENPMM